LVLELLPLHRKLVELPAFAAYPLWLKTVRQHLWLRRLVLLSAIRNQHEVKLLVKSPCLSLVKVKLGQWALV
jgi:hypothetical protein